MLNYMYIDILAVFQIRRGFSCKKVVPIFSDCFYLDSKKIYANEYNETFYLR